MRSFFLVFFYSFSQYQSGENRVLRQIKSGANNSITFRYHCFIWSGNFKLNFQVFCEIFECKSESAFWFRWNFLRESWATAIRWVRWLESSLSRIRKSRGNHKRNLNILGLKMSSNSTQLLLWKNLNCKVFMQLYRQLYPLLNSHFPSSVHDFKSKYLIQQCHHRAPKRKDLN